MPPTPDPFDRIVAAIAQGFADAEARQARTGIHFDSTGISEFRRMLTDAVSEGTAKTAVTGGKGGVPKIHNPHIPSTGGLPGLEGAPKVQPHAYRFERGSAGVVQAASQFLAHRVAQRTTNAIHDTAQRAMQAQLDRYGQGETVGAYNQATGKFTVHTASGQSYEQAPSETTSAAISGISSTYKRGSMAAGALAGIGSGQGMFAGLAEGAMMAGAPEIAIAIPAIKAGVEAVQEAAKLPSQIRAAGAQYQSIYGGTNAAGIGQRVQQSLFGVGQMFDMGSAQAEQAFQGASALGLSGQQRGNALTNIVHLYNNLGLQVSDSLKLIQTEIEGGNKELQGFADSIHQVAQAARAGGLNVGGFLTTQFNNNLQAMAQNVGLGPTSQSVAAGVAQAQAGLGAAGQGIGFQGLFSYSTLSQVGATRGMSPEAMMAQLQQPGAAGQKVLGQIQGTLWQRLGPIMQPYMGIIRARITALAQAGVKPGDLTKSNYLQDIVAQIEQADAQGSQAWMNTVYSIAQSFGISVQGYEDAAIWAVGMAVNQISPQLGFSLTGNQANLNAQPLNKQQVGQLTSAVADLHPGGSRGGGARGIAPIKGVVGQELKNIGITAGQTKLDPSQTAYIQYLQKNGGQTSPVLEAALGNKALRGGKYIVQDNGQNKTVDLATLISQYADQADTAIVAKGGGGKGSGYAGETLSYATGATKTQAASSTQAPKGGKSGGTITVAPTPYLQNLLQFASPDGLNVATTNTANLPANQYPSPSGRPGSSY